MGTDLGKIHFPFSVTIMSDKSEANHHWAARPVILSESFMCTKPASFKKGTNVVRTSQRLKA